MISRGTGQSPIRIDVHAKWRRLLSLIAEPQLFAIAFVFAWPTFAAADPCEGELPARAGVPFAGTVRYVVDGDGWCVSSDSNPNTWIEVRSSDFDAMEVSTEAGRRGQQIARDLLMGRQMSCVSSTGRDGRRVITHDRVLAVCRVDGRRVAQMLREAGVPEGGN